MLSVECPGCGPMWATGRHDAKGEVQERPIFCDGAGAGAAQDTRVVVIVTEVVASPKAVVAHDTMSTRSAQVGGARGARGARGAARAPCVGEGVEAGGSP